MTRYVYGIVHSPNAWDEMFVPDGAATDIDFVWGWFLEDEDATHLEVVTLNQDDYWRGWFYYNDMSYGEDAGPVEVNTEEHLDLHWEANNSSGHYDCLRYEHVVNERTVTTRVFQSVGREMWDYAAAITTHQHFATRLPPNDTDRPQTD